MQKNNNMRLGQLARKLDIKRTEIQKILKKELKVEIGEHPNTKVEDIHVEYILKKFNVVDEPEVKIVEKVVEVPKAVKMEKTTEKIEEKAPQIAEQIVEHIETQKVEKLTGPKILGKIELPEPPSDMVEIDGVMIDRKEIKAKEQEKKKQEREDKRKERELAKQKRELREQFKEESETFVSDKDRKKQERIQEERRKQQAAYDRKKKKEHYINQVNNVKKKDAVKKSSTTVNEQVETAELENTNISKEASKGNAFQRFWKWLTTE